jgi:hypothetical protein
MIYFLVTTSLFNNCPIRESQYTNGIINLKRMIEKIQINNYKIIIIENNGERDTILNKLDCEVFYTRNNFLPIHNKGYKELQDIFDCIKKYNILDDDFIVKMTGRYILDHESNFMNIIKNLNNTKYECVIKYGSYLKPSYYKIDDCVTGLIGMSCFYVKQIEYPTTNNECVEWKWAKVTRLINNNKICPVHHLGIHICPGSNRYIKV